MLNRIEPKMQARLINKMMTHFFKDCEIPRYKDYFDGWRNEMLLKQNVDCNPDNLCFRDRGDKFKQPPICAEDLSTLEHYGDMQSSIHKKCPLNEGKIKELENMCRINEVRIIKSFELPDIKNSIPKNLQSDPYFSILLFVRDPRALAMSKLSQLGENVYEIRTIGEDCTNWDKFISIMRKFVWKCRMNVVRYEDFVNDADYQSKEFINHFGIEFPEPPRQGPIRARKAKKKSGRVYGSDSSASNSNDTDSDLDLADSDFLSDKPDQREFVDFEELIYAQTHNGQSWNGTQILDPGETIIEYTSIRNSVSVVYKWLTQISFEQLKMIESVPSCSKVMDSLGYKKLSVEPNGEEIEEIDFVNIQQQMISMMENNEIEEDMNEEYLPIDRLYGTTQRYNSQHEKNFKKYFETEKIWGWDREGY